MEEAEGWRIRGSCRNGGGLKEREKERERDEKRSRTRKMSGK